MSPSAVLILMKKEHRSDPNYDHRKERRNKTKKRIELLKQFKI